MMSRQENVDLRENLNIMNQSKRSAPRYSTKRKGRNSTSACSDEARTPEQLSRKKTRYFEPDPKASSKDWFDLTKKYEELQDGLHTRLHHDEKRKQRGLKTMEREEDPVILLRREKQIEYGKNTIAYDKYAEAVPKSKRTKFHPRTPDRYAVCSRRSFDTQVKIWRKALHNWEQFTIKQEERYLNKKKIKEEEKSDKQSVKSEDQSAGSSSVDDKENNDLESLPLYDSDDSLDLLNDDDDDLGFDF